MTHVEHPAERTVFVMVDIVRYIDASYPGFVECRLVDANEQEWYFHDKVPIFTSADLDASSIFPQSGVMACQIIGRHVRADGREITEIDCEQPWGLVATTGQTRFDVYGEQIRGIKRE